MSFSFAESSDDKSVGNTRVFNSSPARTAVNVTAFSTDKDDYFKIDGLTFTNSVPDHGSTVALLGVALLVLAALKRRFAD